MLLYLLIIIVLALAIGLSLILMCINHYPRTRNSLLKLDKGKQVFRKGKDERAALLCYLRNGDGTKLHIAKLYRVLHEWERGFDVKCESTCV